MYFVSHVENFANIYGSMGNCKFLINQQICEVPEVLYEDIVLQDREKLGEVFRDIFLILIILVIS